MSKVVSDLPAETMTWEVSSKHDLLERAQVITSVALADIVNPSRGGLADSATLRVAKCLRAYAEVDAQAEALRRGNVIDPTGENDG